MLYCLYNTSKKILDSRIFSIQTCGIKNFTKIEYSATLGRIMLLKNNSEMLTIPATGQPSLYSNVIDVFSNAVFQKKNHLSHATFVINKGFTVSACGSNLYNELGVHTADEYRKKKKILHEHPTFYDRPRIVNIVKGEEIICIAAGGSRTLFLTKKHKVIKTTRENNDTEICLDSLKEKKIIHIAAGLFSYFFVDDKCNVYSCGQSWHAYKLGHGNKKEQLTPKRIEFFTENKIKIVHVEANHYVTYCVARNGNIYMFGCDYTNYAIYIRSKIEKPTVLKGFSFIPIPIKIKASFQENLFKAQQTRKLIDLKTNCFYV